MPPPVKSRSPHSKQGCDPYRASDFLRLTRFGVSKDVISWDTVFLGLFEVLAVAISICCAITPDNDLTDYVLCRPEMRDWMRAHYLFRPWPHLRNNSFFFVIAYVQMPNCLLRWSQRNQEAGHVQYIKTEFENG